MSEKIDFVMLWVDPSDLKWQKERAKYEETKGGRRIGEGDGGYSSECQVETVKQGTDTREVRYRDWDNLQYFFRSVEKYAPWVNKIHFVTYGHLPKWLDTSNPKLNVVKHEDYIPGEYLPTFNSNTIILNLHRIKGLSEKFVLFNDDMILMRKVSETDFFKNGLPCDAAVMAPAIMQNKNDFDGIRLNNISIINTHFSKKEVISKARGKWVNLKYEPKYLVKSLLSMPWKVFPGLQSLHGANSYLKATFEKVWKAESEVLDATCRRRFRNNKLDVSDWMMENWQIAEGNFAPRKTNFGKYYEIKNETDFAEVVGKSRAGVLCLNDSDELSEKDFERKKKELSEELEKRFPERSSFERDLRLVCEKDSELAGADGLGGAK